MITYNNGIKLDNDITFESFIFLHRIAYTARISIPFFSLQMG